jgi:hypothetical protein
MCGIECCIKDLMYWLRLEMEERRKRKRNGPENKGRQNMTEERDRTKEIRIKKE